jgi:antitoxin CptB
MRNARGWHLGGRGHLCVAGIGAIPRPKAAKVAVRSSSTSAADSSMWQRDVMPSLEERRRRAYYRAVHRGTKEMDWLLGRYADARIASMAEAELDTFERLLMLPDPELHQWIAFGAEASDSELAPLVLAIRKFHGLEPQK